MGVNYSASLVIGVRITKAMLKKQKSDTPGCGHKVPPVAKFCPECGAKVVPGWLYPEIPADEEIKGVGVTAAFPESDTCYIGKVFKTGNSNGGDPYLEIRSDVIEDWGGDFDWLQKALEPRGLWSDEIAETCGVHLLLEC